jgi:hypothetical protein
MNCNSDFQLLMILYHQVRVSSPLFDITFCCCKNMHMLEIEMEKKITLIKHEEKKPQRFFWNG